MGAIRNGLETGVAATNPPMPQAANPPASVRRNDRRESMRTVYLVSRIENKKKVRIIRFNRLPSRLLACLRLFSCVSGLAGLLGVVAPCHADTVAVLYALEADLAELKKAAEQVKPSIKIGSRTVATMKLGQHTIHAVKMGSGCVATAVSASAVLSRFDCDFLVSIGPAGALRDDYQIGSWVQVAEVLPYQAGTLTSTGFIPQDAVRLETSKRPPDEWKKLPAARLVSGETFVAADSERQRLADFFEAGIIDMNTAGLVLAAANHDLPIWVWRVISDKADAAASADFRHFAQRYKGEGGRLVAEAIRLMPNNPANPMAHDVLRALIEPKGD